MNGWLAAAFRGTWLGLGVYAGQAIRCLNCHGAGYIVEGYGNSKWPQLCRACGGTGMQKVRAT